MRLSTVDREILKVLLNPNNDKRSSALLSNKLGVPVTTIQRRRKRLEKEYLELSYSLQLEKFGWRRVDLLISTRSGKTILESGFKSSADDIEILEGLDLLGWRPFAPN